MNLPPLSPTEKPPWVAMPEPSFGRLPENAVGKFLGDTAGVYLPKIPVTRSKAQFFEDAFLEFVEDAAFYFTIPLVSEYVFGPLFNKMTGLSKLALESAKKNPKETIDWIGTPLAQWSKTEGAAVARQATQHAPELAKKLLGAKAGTLLASFGVAAGFEYLIQHTKNLITSKAFHTNNFTGVAGLEDGRTQLRGDEQDPVAKAKKRWKQVPLVVAGVLAASAALAAGIAHPNAKTLPRLAEKILPWVDFKPGRDKFDLPNAMLLGLTALVGATSYMDAARDGLERKETGLRLLLVVPYLNAGKELAANAIAWGLERWKFNTPDGPLQIKDIVTGHTPDGKPVHFSFFDKTWNWKSPFTPAKVLDFNALRKVTHDEISALKVHSEVKDLISTQYHNIGTGKYMLSTLIMGLGVLILTYNQTRQRYKKMREEAALKQSVPSLNAKPSVAGLHTSFAAVPIAQGNKANPFNLTILPGVSETAFTAFNKPRSVAA